jgi:hypothetical protein
VGVGAQYHALAILPRERDPVSIVQEAGWPQDWSGQVWKTLPPVEFDPQTIQPIKNHYTDYTIEAQESTTRN